jgi:hypothetical protein
LAGALLVIVAHGAAGFMDEGRVVWRPVGHGTVVVPVTWVVASILAVRALVAARGRSPAALLALGITVASAMLLLSV